MIKRIGSRLSYANVMATLAVFGVLAGGTAVAVDKLNATSVDGVSAKRIDFTKTAQQTPPIPPFETIARLGGLRLQARCYSDSGTFMDERAKSARNNAEIQIEVTGSGGADHAIDRDFNKGDTLGFPAGGGNQGQGTLTYSTRKGAQVTAVFQLDQGSLQSGFGRCVFGGHALFSPAR